MEGSVFNIQKLSIHDGPGIRTTVFLKGCPLNCLWCSNPESQSVELEVACFANRCIKCGYCAEICPQQVIDKETFQITDRSKCDLCMECIKECCTGSKQLIGKSYTIEELYEEILKDKTFYDSSGGGVTFSGGEPFMQSEFLMEMLKTCKDGGVHTAIETTGLTETETLLETSKYLDLVFYDLKHMDDDRHKELTEVSNKKILSNLAELSKVHDNITVRIPVIPTLNDSVENIRATAAYAGELGISKLELLPYHNLGENKYGQIGREYTLSEIQAPTEEYMEQLAAEARDAIGNGKTVVDVMPSM